MTVNLRLWCCPQLRREVEAVVAGSADLTGLSVEVYPTTCLQGSQDGGDAFMSVFRDRRDGMDAILGGGCLQNWSSAVEDSGNLVILAPQQCFYLLAPSALVDSLISDGAFVMTPGWLSNWREHIEAWGFEQQTARQFFQETTRKLVLLDTGIHGDCLAQLETMGEYLGLEHQAIPVGLDMLELSLERLLLDPRWGARNNTPSDRFFSDHLMVIDLLTDLLNADGESEALALVENLFSLLFAPGRYSFIPASQSPESEPGPREKGYAWLESGRGFVVDLNRRGERLGSLVLDDLAFAEYKERYLALALPLAKVCAIAISNARALELSRKAELAMRSIAGIVKSSDDAIIGKTLDGIIVSWNRGAHRNYGYTESEVLGRHISFLTPEERPDEIPRIILKIIDNQTVDQVETVWKAKNGSLIDVSVQVSPIFDENGRIVGASSIARDITREKRKAEQERRSLEAQLLQAQRLESVGRLAGGVAHDFNNILGIILGYSELLLENTQVSKQMRQDLDQIHQASKRAMGLTRQLLAFARKQVLQKTNLSLGEAVTNFSKMIDRLIGEDIVMKMVLSEDLPQIYADPSMVEQILLNLAVNARDAMPEGGTLTIETKKVCLDKTYASTRFEVVPGKYVMLVVSDTGMGMDEDTRHKIFEPFFTTKGIGKGTGLGLSTVYGIVKQHDGFIWVYSEIDQGTSFKVYFPIADSGVEVFQEVEEDVAPSVGGETILVTEDDSGLRQLICVALEKAGYRVLCAGGATEAEMLASRHQGHIHLLLTDVVMPEMNGKLLYESLAQHRPDIKVMFMSGYTENVIAHRGVLQKGVNFIQKPFTVKQLTHKLASILAS